MRVFVGLDPVDMRGSFNSLGGAARRLGLEPSDGHLYLFFNRRRRLCKMLWFDGSGWCIYSKRLERGTFEVPACEPGAVTVTVDTGALASLLEGIPLSATKRKWYRRAA
ncbi:MAG: IS66 family insertion sequence element accessory protein TnpB [Phycisphaeraceae bacterium]|nr:IS66 family insertion sequence element accessory protein TnpB [Actinomycetes bacterium]MCP4797359.1 IS66 family insertion sequence element accessory protein TnpB [Phycisphaeraceae bacterium]MCP4851830.1 IS66 family insertion sequence element accessory protein TnpB [Actinomycetes bacterium]